MTVTPDLIASLVQKEFDKLPTKRKPVVRDNGLREWVPLAGIVAEGNDGKLTCLSLATGMKCLPSAKLRQAQGNVLHDWHAETLAIRAFNRFVLDECRALASSSKSSSGFIRRRSSAEMTAIPTPMPDSVRSNGDDDDDDDGIYWHGQPFEWREDVLLYMYCSEAPCGDASMELTMASQVNATPWAIPLTLSTNPYEMPSSSQPPEPGLETNLPGRAYFSQLGIVRRKPSRGDAPPTLSKSCSDKLALHQCTSLFSSLTSLLVSPSHAYISTLVLPKVQYSASGCRRAFSGGKGEEEDGHGISARMAPISSQIRNWGAGYAFQPFSVKTTDLEFAFSRRPTTNTPTHSPPKITPSPLSIAQTASPTPLVESTLNGVLQGRKASDASLLGASFMSRRKMWTLAVEIVALLSRPLPIKPDFSPNDLQNDESLNISPPSNGETSTESNVLRIQNTLLGNGTTRAAVSSSSLSLSPTASTSTSTATSTSTSPSPSTPTYGDVKNAPLLRARRKVKEDARRLALKGWVRNLGDEDFVL
ncbi:hypothetical protein HD806DRAFT_502804 [Xylariaceae sp. AK1471]|nr:hypothetical protein HD806DRAFT_502804 [Xylariaceae sp. AK1471]